MESPYEACQLCAARKTAEVIGIAPTRKNTLCATRTIFDRLFHEFCLIGLDAQDVAVQRLFNLVHVAPGLLVMHEIDGYALAPEATGAAL